MGAALDFGALFGDGESSGDLDRLIREFGWTEGALVSVFSVLTVFTCLTLLVFFLCKILGFTARGDKAGGGGPLGKARHRSPRSSKSVRDGTWVRPMD